MAATWTDVTHPPLPNYGTRVLVCTADKAVFLSRRSFTDAVGEHWEDIAPDKAVTHWMTLPDPPV